MASLGQAAQNLSSRRSRQSVDTIRFLANHILLPPKLPQSLEEDGENGIEEIIDFVADVADAFAEHLGTTELTAEALITYIKHIKRCNTSKGLKAKPVREVINALRLTDSTLFYTAAQNAAITVHRKSADEFIFEMFELSPTNSSIMSSQGALKRSFPGVALRISRDRLTEEAFLIHLARYLGHLSSQLIDEFQPVTRKAKASSIETRDTTDPVAVTDMLTSLLLSIGVEHRSAPTTKRTREDVCWDDTHISWRRSPFWLALRVGVQRMLTARIGQDEGFKVYKNFMALIVARVCDCIATQDLELASHARAKLARRVDKLAQRKDLILSLQPYFESVFSRVNTLLKEEWSRIKTSCSREVLEIPGQQPKDLRLRLKHSEQTLRDILKEDTMERSAASYDFSCIPRETRTQRPFRAFKPNFPTSNAIDIVLALSDFESWIKKESYNWDFQIKPCPDDCQIASTMFTSYLKAAEVQYSSNVDCQSIMLLTLLEIWAFLDRITIKLIPLVRSFSPELPASFLRQLRLADLDDMKRAVRVEEYIARRTEDAKRHDRSIFYSQGGTCFSELYYDSHEEDMRPLLRQIELEMEQERSAKKAEWYQLRARKAKLLAESQSISCTREQNEWGGWDHVQWRGSCRKCSLEDQALALSILPIEETLPESSTQKKAVLFELRCPTAFKTWREVTWQLVNDLGMDARSHNPQQVYQHLDNYQKLRHHFRVSESRFSLASTNKSYLSSHYGSAQTPDVAFEDLCKPHGFNWQLYDCLKGHWVTRDSSSPELMKTYRGYFPQGTGLDSLKPAVIGTSLLPNQIIADQALCPNALSLSEYNNFKLLRSGERLQWLNILLELAASHLDHNRLETSLLFSQAALQLGNRKLNDPLRQAHWVFDDKPFCERLLTVLNERFDSISDNWQEIFTMNTLLVILLRLLSLESVKDRRAAKLVLLDRMRLALRSWTRSLLQKLRSTHGDEERSRLSQKVLQAALLCRLTYKDYSLLSMEERPQCGLEPFFECGIVVANHAPIKLSNASPEVAHNMLREWKIAYSMEEEAGVSLVEEPESILCAIKKFWPGDHQLHAWEALPQPNGRWFLSSVKTSNSENPQTIHFNVLDSQLLIDGKPLAKLPSAYLHSPIYSRVFGEHRFEVFPSAMAGMTYKASMNMHDQEIHFGWRAKNLVIRSKQGERVREFLPPEMFGDGGDLDLPFSLISQKAHWLELAGPHARTIHILPLSELWVLDGADWKIDVSNKFATKQGSQLLEPSASCAKAISRVLMPLELQKHIIVTESSEGEVTATLPRLKLTFRLRQPHRLYCVELDAMVSKIQDLGTFYGLKNFLLLRPDKAGAEIVIVPKGKIGHNKSEEHVSVWMNLESSSEHFSYARFNKNSVLGRLDCLGNEQDLLLMAYLHALTAHVLSDPLTQRSGTEESLRILQEFRRQQYRPLDDACRSIIEAISRLSPLREFYPEHLQVMQIATWDPALRISSQHEDFRRAAKALLEQSDRISEVCTGTKCTPVRLRGKEELYTRARFRNLVYRKVTEQFESRDAIIDSMYQSRDNYSKSLRCQRALEVAEMVQSWDNHIEIPRAIGVSMEGLHNIKGFNQPLALSHMLQLLTTNLGSLWGFLYTRCRNSNRARDQGDFTFLFGTLAFGKDIDIPLLKTLLATSIHLAARAPPPPTSGDFLDFQYRFTPHESDFRQALAKSDVRPKPPAAPTGENLLHWQEQRSRSENRKRAHNEQLQRSVSHAAQLLVAQWPRPSAEAFTSQDHRIDIYKAIKSLEAKWSSWYRSWLLSDFFDTLQAGLASLRPQPCWQWPDAMEVDARYQWPHHVYDDVPTIECVMRDIPLDIDEMAPGRPGRNGETSGQTGVLFSGFTDDSEPSSSSICDLDDLEELVEHFEQASSQTRMEFGKDLRGSLSALRNSLGQTPETIEPIESFAVEDLQRSVSQEELHLDDIKEHIQGYLQSHKRFHWLNQGGLWPSMTAINLLECLQSRQIVDLPDKHFSCLLRFALQITEVQRRHRLVSHRKSSNTLALNAEMKQITSSRSWDIKKCPDWLLLEIDSDMLLRKDQISTAQRMIKPETDSNSVYQLQMGKGKSSFIVPACLCVLADGRRLARAIVTRPLLTQMARILSKSVCRLLGRSILHLPYSRSSCSAPHITRLFEQMHKDISKQGGVALCLPDHLLSFRLNGLQRLLDDRSEEAEAMLDTQSWFDKNCRDLMDESDHTLATRTQLIYPSGSPTIVDGGTNRWQTAQNLLRTVYKCLEEASEKYPDAIKRAFVRPMAYPLVHILRQQAEEILKVQVIEEVCGPKSRIFQTSKYNGDSIQLLRKCLAGADMSEKEFSRIEAILSHDRIDINSFLVLRGLIGGGIMMLAFKKRWNVNYGLHLERPTLIAVPYQAKGKPSAASEFGHPDVAILLTLLAYYYTGLSQDQFRQVLIHVQLEQDPTLKWDEWINWSNCLPDSLRSWYAVNLEDEGQMAQLWQALSHSIPLIDYFLDKLVFPKAAKEFEFKLVSSSWDLPLADQCLTTGFSGTNGNSCHMPLSIKQSQIPEEAHTNAEVLYFLLQDRNRGYIAASSDQGDRLSVEDLIKLVTQQQPRIDVILDAGAQILEMDNKDVARCWLRLRTDAPAAVYFDAADDLQVIYQDDRVERLDGSPYFSQLGQALLYLDEEHCRGTDLKLPSNARAALTLGMKQTKDHLVQAAMRMRQLGHLQSVVFFGAPEVHQAIIDHNKLKYNEPIDSRHVLNWSMEQSCAEIDLYRPLFLSQGYSFIRRTELMKRLPEASSEERKFLASQIKEREKFSLVELYGATRDSAEKNDGTPQSGMKAQLDALAQILHARAQLGLATVNEEQERELEAEVEEERQVQRPAQLQPQQHSIHPDVCEFARSGLPKYQSLGYRKAFDGLVSTSIKWFQGLRGKQDIEPKVLATYDFERTVQLGKSERQDDYLCNVRWVLVSNMCDEILIISQYEANGLLPTIRSSTKSHLVTYDAPNSRQMVTRFGHFGHYSIPSLPSGWKLPSQIELALGLFAGRQYFPWQEYDLLRSWLRRLGRRGNADFNDGKRDSVVEIPSHVRDLLHELTGLRNYNASFDETPMGFVCRDRPLTEDHPGFVED